MLNRSLTQRARWKDQQSQDLSERRQLSYGQWVTSPRTLSKSSQQTLITIHSVLPATLVLWCKGGRVSFGVLWYGLALQLHQQINFIAITIKFDAFRPKNQKKKTNSCASKYIYAPKYLRRAHLLCLSGGDRELGGFLIKATGLFFFWLFGRVHGSYLLTQTCTKVLGEFQQQ